MAKKKKKTSKKKSGSFLRSAAKWLFVAALWGGIFLFALTAWYAMELPHITRAADFERKTSIIIKAADGSVAARYGEIRGNTIEVQDLPAHLIYAILATEDRRFYQHFGIDPLGILRAMVVNIREGGIAQGGSTITQQLAKNLFLTHERTLKRKIQEALLALWLEHELTKDEILSAYLNRVYMGSGTYGVDAASKLYFGHPATEVNLREAAMLAGIFKAPSRYSPLNNPYLANERADLVLQSMADAGYITKEEADGLTVAVPRPFRQSRDPQTERYFTDWVVDGVGDLIGTPDQNIIVETTLLPFIQERAEAAIFETIQTHGEERKVTQGAMIVMDHNGAVLALVGGADYGDSQFNRAIQAKRAPGSSFKPVVYLTALENGWEPDDLIYDGPITSGRYRPENFEGEYANAEVTLTEALTYSMNTAAYRLMQEVGIDSVMDTARRLGIISPLERDLSIALGSSGVSLLEMVVAYGVIANDGYAVYPYAIKRIVGEDGYVYYNRRNSRPVRRVADEQAVQKLEAMLRSVVENGTGRAANFTVTVAGKTGTSNESRDAWFLGYTDKLIGGVWVGNDDNSPMDKVTGGSFPARIFANVVGATHEHYRPMARLERMVDSGFTALVDRLTGQSAEPGYNPATAHYNP